MAKLENIFMSQLLSSQDFISVAEEGLNKFFFTGIDRKAFTFISEHYNRHGKTPSYYAFRRKFPDYIIDVDDVEDESMRYWCDEIRRKKKTVELTKAIKKTAESLQSDDDEEALNILRSAVLRIENEIKKQDNMSIQDVEERKKKYLALKGSGGITGLTTGFDALDNMTGGLHNGELITLMGFTGIGKSWMLILIGVHLTLLGFRVLFGTTEMSKEMVWRRIDAVINKFDYSVFSKGLLTEKQEKKYFKYLEEMRNSDKYFVVEQIDSGVSQVSALMEKHNPDIVLIDGAYLMVDEEGEEDNHAGILRIWNGLHKLAINKNKPVCVTTQSKDESKTSLKSLNFAKAIATACDVVMALEQDKQMRFDKEMLIRPLKLREGELRYNTLVNWDFNKMNFDVIYTKEDSPDEDNDDVDMKGIVINI